MALIVLLSIGMLALSSSNSYISLFVAIELQSLVLYILLATTVGSQPVGFNNTSLVSLSYLINAATATALLLYGVASSSTLLVLITLCWKLGIVPVHV